MQNPFETGHIKNYILLYASVVLIMILFFIASTLFHDVREMDKKTFNTEVKKAVDVSRVEESNPDNQSQTKKFRLMEKAY